MDIKSIQDIKILKHYIKNIEASSQRRLLFLLMPTRRISEKRRFWGFFPGKRANIQRHPDVAARDIIEACFKEPDDRTEADFRRRYRITREVNIKITRRISEHDPFFQGNADAFEKPGIPMKNKFAAAFEMQSYGSLAHHSERWLKLSETAILKC